LPCEWSLVRFCNFLIDRTINMKNSLLIAALVALTLSACGKKEEAAPAPAPAAAPAAAAPAADAAPAAPAPAADAAAPAAAPAADAAAPAAAPAAAEPEKK
jgi:hypothetical protein